MIRKLTKFVYSEGPEWRFRLEQDMLLRVEGAKFGRHDFLDGKGVLRMAMDGDTIFVPALYSWDGSSPKVRIFGRWTGTPDFEGTRLASMIHDTLYQFLHTSCFPLERQDCDRLFGAIMKAEGFPLWWVYSGAVLTFGGIHHGVGTLFKGEREGDCALH